MLSKPTRETLSGGERIAETLSLRTNDGIGRGTPVQGNACRGTRAGERRCRGKTENEKKAGAA